MDENSFVKYLKAEFPFSRGEGIGDDTSIVRSGTGFQLITKDILLEGIHFDRSYFTLDEIGYRAVGVNISDIAAMGGIPEYLYLGLGVSEDYREKEIRSFFKGVKSGCKKWNVELAGGDLSASKQGMFISITMIGTALHPVKRGGAGTGDLIGLSRVTGESAIGLALLSRGENIPRFTNRHKDPDPEISKGKILAGYVSSMIDISDGLIMDLERLMSNSGKGCKVIYENIPVTDTMRDVCRNYKLPEKEMVLSGGEDFALLFTIGKEKEKELRKTGIKHYIIGEVTEKKGVNIFSSGKILDLEIKGFDHFNKLNS